jgi:hypothetical protein
MIDIIFKLATIFYKNLVITRETIAHMRTRHKIKYCDVNMTTEKCDHCKFQLRNELNRDENLLIRYNKFGYRIQPCSNPCQFSIKKFNPESLRNISSYKFLSSEQKNPSDYYTLKQRELKNVKSWRHFFHYIPIRRCVCYECDPYYEQINHKPYRRRWKIQILL